MMARSKCSNQRPDTLMQDRLLPARRNHLQRTAGPYIRVKLRNTQPEQMSSALHPRTDMGFTGPTKFSRSNVMECVECALLNTARPKGIRPKCPTATVQGHPAFRCAIARGRNNEQARLRLT